MLLISWSVRPPKRERVTLALPPSLPGPSPTSTSIIIVDGITEYFVARIIISSLPLSTISMHPYSMVTKAETEERECSMATSGHRRATNRLRGHFIASNTGRHSCCPCNMDHDETLPCLH